MFSYLYKLQKGVPIRCKDVAEWHDAFLMRDNIIKIDEIVIYGNYVRVVTAFTGIDHGDGRLFQTYIIGGLFNEKFRRCHTIAQACAQHDEIVDIIVEEYHALKN